MKLALAITATSARAGDVYKRQGLRRLEYRGYDSAGLAVVDSEGHMTRVRRLGKVQMLAQAVEEDVYKRQVRRHS